MFIERIINDKQKQKGVTLIELVIVMVLAGILSVVVSVFIAQPISAYASVARRASLVDAAEMTLRRMSRDIQSAVPNSVRVKKVGDRSAVEMLNIVEGMRYRGSVAGAYLDFIQPITNFHVLGRFQYALANPSCAANKCRLVVYNTGANIGGTDNPAPGANVYSTVMAPACLAPASGCNPPPNSVTITPVSTTVTLTNPGNEGNISMSPAVQFALPSPRQRIEIVDTPVTYLCDLSSNQQQITRYANYTITPVQPIDPTIFPLKDPDVTTAAQLTSHVTACSFMYNPGTPTRNGVITMSITLTSGGETITLMRQVGVNNVP
ncbi:MAG TPA: type II secretion system protein [Gammaproteobacteria bacterium]|nr:type II secretion system protein [Gammaproteobacteria bacterium]